MRTLAATAFAMLMLATACSSDNKDSEDPASPTGTAAPSSATTPSSAPPPASSPTGDATIAGDWKGTYQSTKYPSTSGTFTVTFTQSGTRITGTAKIASDCVDTGTISGQLTGDKITFGAVDAAENIDFDGTIDVDAMAGNYHSGPACGDDDGTWTATRN